MPYTVNISVQALLEVYVFAPLNVLVSLNFSFPHGDSEIEVLRRMIPFANPS